MGNGDHPIADQHCPWPSARSGPGWLPVGSLIYIDPSKPLRPNDFVLVKSGRTGRIAIYRGRTSDSIVLDTGNGQDEKVAISTLAGFWKIVSVEYP